MKFGSLAKYRRGLGRAGARSPSPRAPSSSLGLSAAQRQQLRGLSTPALVTLVKEAASANGVQTPLVRFAAALLSRRSEGVALLQAEGLEWMLSGGEAASHFFVGWLRAGTSVDWVDAQFTPSVLDSELLERLEALDGCGGVLGRCDDAGEQARATALQRSPWWGDSLAHIGSGDPRKLRQALAPVSGARTQKFLGSATNLTLALAGRRVVLLTPDGRAHRLSRVESLHLSLVGLLPRHPHQPLHWWEPEGDVDASDDDEGSADADAPSEG